MPLRRDCPKICTGISICMINSYDTTTSWRAVRKALCCSQEKSAMAGFSHYLAIWTMVHIVAFKSNLNVISSSFQTYQRENSYRNIERKTAFQTDSFIKPSKHLTLTSPGLLHLKLSGEPNLLSSSETEITMSFGDVCPEVVDSCKQNRENIRPLPGPVVV